MLYHSPFQQVLSVLPNEHLICIEGKEQLTAAQLRDRSERLALYLASKGLQKGDRVLMACANGVEFLELFMALIHLRVKIALVDPHMGNQRYESKIKQFQPSYAFIDSRLLLLQEHPILRFFYHTFSPRPFYIPFSKQYQRFATGWRLPILQKHARLQYPPKTTFEWQKADEADELVLVYTSGTLAEPKAVVHTVSTLFESMKAVASLFPTNQKGILVTHLPQFALIGMLTGFQTLFWKENLSAKARLDFIDTHQVSILFGPPAEYWPLILYCQQHQRRLPASLNHLLLGSAPVLKPILQQLRTLTDAKITCLYGMTEHLVVCHTDGDEKLNYSGPGDWVGTPLATMEYQVAEDGELFIRSPLLFKRYYHQESRPEFYPTGDLVVQHGNGLALKGRKKNMIIRGNKNIYPALYEPTIVQIKGVKEAVMMGLYNESKHDEELILVVETDGSLSELQLSNALKSGSYAIDSDAQPDYILLMEIPKAGRQQKVDQARLLEQVKTALRE